MRWLYHVVPTRDLPSRNAPYAPASLAREGFVHCSFRPAVLASARLYFPSDATLAVLRIDPRRLAVPVEIADTPRGPMPHVHGAIAAQAIVEVLSLDAIEQAPDAVEG